MMIGGRSAQLYTYNGLAQAPRLVVKPGDAVRLRLENRLAQTTNLHYHGLHIPPSGNADNSFLRIPPGETQTYEFQIPADHPAGTYWYHPHAHPNAADQVSRGLAGVLLVRGGLDDIAAIAAMPERILVLQDFRLNLNGEIANPSMMERMQGREGNFITISGEVNPTIPISPNGWIRLRILNASASRYFRLHIEGHPMFLLAVDGGALPSPQVLSEVLLTPGERVEVAVYGERAAGSFRIVSLPYDRHSGEDIGGMMGGMMGRGTTAAQPSALPLAGLLYEGTAVHSDDLPNQLIAVEPLPPSDLPVRHITLGQGMHMTFTINGKAFNERRIDVSEQVGTIADWEFINNTGMDHPMHIHTNSFQVLDGAGSAVPAWKDTVNVRANSRIQVRSRFEDYTGLSVFHCHILDHEDLGMMATLQLRF